MAIKVISRKSSILDNFYLPGVLVGLSLTIKHFFVNLLTSKKIVTIKYPEEKRPISERWRGRHRLTRHENGFIKCVACYMCETICPAHCIHIEAAEVTNDKTVEKYPRVFDIDELRCVFCGFCVEACPKDAIRMDTGIVAMAYSGRSKFNYTRNLLLDDYQENEFTKYNQIPLPSSEKEALASSVGIVADKNELY